MVARQTIFHQLENVVSAPTERRDPKLNPDQPIVQVFPEPAGFHQAPQTLVRRDHQPDVHWPEIVSTDPLAREFLHGSQQLRLRRG